MGFTESELKFIDDNAELIEEGQDGLKRLFDSVNNTFSGKQRYKMIAIISYNCLGSSMASIEKSNVDLVNGEIIGCLANRTPARAKGVPLLPPLFTSKTPVVLFKIDKGKIAHQEEYKLISKEDFNKKQSEGGYNLVVLNKPEYVDSVKKCFGGVLLYSISVGGGEFLPSVRLSVEANSPESATKQLVSFTSRRLAAVWGLEGFDKMTQDLATSLEPQIVFNI